MAWAKIFTLCVKSLVGRIEISLNFSYVGTIVRVAKIILIFLAILSAILLKGQRLIFKFMGSKSLCIITPLVQLTQETPRPFRTWAIIDPFLHNLGIVLQLIMGKER